MKRPMFYWVSLFALGEILSIIFPIKWIGFIICDVLILVIIMWCLLDKNAGYKGLNHKNIGRKKPDKNCDNYRENNVIWAVGTVFLLFGFVYMENTYKKIVDINYVGKSRVDFVGKITKIDSNSNGNTYIVKVRKMEVVHDAEQNKCCKDVRNVNIKLLLDSGEELMLGSLVEGRGKVELFSHASNSGEYDEQSYQYGKGIVLALKETELQRVYEPIFPIREMLHRLREYLAKVYDDILTEGNASLAKAMVLGDKEDLDVEIKQLYQQNGIAHLIAISGLHIAMIGGSLYRILRKRIGGYVLPAGIGIVFIILYGMMTGLSGATMRAVFMIIISIGAEVSGRRYDLLTAMSVALLFMLLQNPYQLTQAGFLLSFGAVFGIAVIYPVFPRLFSDMPHIVEGLFVSISVQAAILPVLLYFFYEFPIYGVFLNIIVVPLMGVLLALLIFGALLGSFFPGLAKTVMIPVQYIFKIYEGVCNISEKLPFHTMCTGRPPVWWILIYYSGMIMFLLLVYALKLPTHKGNRKTAGDLGVWVLAVAIFYGALFGTFLVPRPLTVCMFDVGQGDGIYIRTPGGRHILMDGGSSSKNKVGNYILKNGIMYYGAKELDYVFISHSDSDHYSGIVELLEDNLIAIKNIVLPKIANPDEAYFELVDMAANKGCHIYYMETRDSLEIDGVSLFCLHPEGKDYQDKNTGSLVLKLSYNSFDMLLTGDADEAAEKEIISRMSSDDIEVLKVAHHGSATSSSETFLERIHPQIACISVGERNRYGHPADEVMERLTTYAGNIYLTKDSGAITIETDGTKYRVIPFVTD